MSEAIRVIVQDPETSEVLGEQIVDNDYVLICAGNAVLTHTNVAGSTHTLTIKKGSRHRVEEVPDET